MNGSVRRGIELFNRGLYEEARAAFDRALADSPDDRSISALRDHARRAAGDPRAPRAPGSAAQASLVEGQRLLRQGKAGEAVRVLSRAIRLDPRLALARFHRGEAYSVLGRWRTALRDFDRALERMPGHADSHYKRALALAGLSREAGSERELRRALASPAGARRFSAASAKARLPRAQRLLESGRRAEAARALERILADDPASGEAYALRGTLRRLEGALERALADFRAALRLAPEELWRRSFGEEECRILAPERAGEDYAWLRAAVQARPRDAAALAWLGLAARRQGRWEEGRRALLRAERLRPAACAQAREWAAKHCCWEAETLLFRGDSAGAMRAFGSAVRVSRRSGWARAWRAAALLWLGLYERALREAEAALASRSERWTPDSRAWARGWRGAALLKLGRPAAAARELEAAVAAHPADAESRVWLAEALLALGRRKEALGHLRRARRLSPRSPWPDILEASARPSAAGALLRRAARLCPRLLAYARARSGGEAEAARAALRLAAGNRTLQPSCLEVRGRSRRIVPLFAEAS